MNDREAQLRREGRKFAERAAESVGGADESLLAFGALCVACGLAGPFPMVLHCPRCGLQHIDEADPASGWTNPPHCSHLCHGCGGIWRPAAVATCGVARLGREGSSDTWTPGDPTLREAVQQIERAPGRAIEIAQHMLRPRERLNAAAPVAGADGAAPICYGTGCDEFPLPAYSAPSDRVGGC